MTKTNFPGNSTGRWALAACTAAVLSACGGGNDVGSVSASQQEAAPLATGATTVQMDVAVLPDAVASQSAQPTYDLAPVELPPPEAVDSNDSSASAGLVPHQQRVSAGLASLPTSRLTLQTLQAARIKQSMHVDLPGDEQATPQASSAAVTTYTPAQIRAAYGLPALPASYTSLSTTQAAQLGAGQTIYIIDAQHDPNVAAELAVFNKTFGLPTCAAKTIVPTAALPLAAASTTGCELAVVYGTSSGTMTATAPAYNSGWATEITLDVQWAHATAPLARIVLIEAPDASLNSLLGAVKVANAMGPGVVSMSFGAAEGNWTSSVDSAFSVKNMSYLAATGDSGAGVSWPSVSPYVLAVGGTSLTYSGAGNRSEESWSGTGGGTSLYTATPSYQQNNSVPSLGLPGHRVVADVAFNANPSTGQYVAIMTPGSSSASWVSAGGTSLSTPQWAGVLAIANALRGVSARAPLGQPHNVLYGQLAAVPGTYASTFMDITKGSDGTCVACYAKVGYDPLSGLGTPNSSSLLSALSGATVASAPVVTPATISGAVGTALTFTASATGSGTLVYSLSGAPSSMSINSSSGIVSWAVPVAGTYNVTVVAKDSSSGLSGQGVYTVSIAAQKPPVVSGANIGGKPGTPLSFNVIETNANPVTFSLTGAPAGMSVNSLGVVTWPTPLLGSYNVTAVVKDNKTGLSATGLYVVKITSAGPVITAAGSSGVAGKALSGSITIADSGVNWLQVQIGGAPLGMVFSMSGLTVTYSWPNPVAGTYTLKVNVLDSAGLTAQSNVLVTVAAK